MKLAITVMLALLMALACNDALCKEFRAELASVTLRKAQGGWMLEYRDCPGCPVNAYRITESSEIYLAREKASPERARIYQKNGAYLHADSSTRTVLRAEFKRD